MENFCSTSTISPLCNRPTPWPTSCLELWLKSLLRQLPVLSFSIYKTVCSNSCRRTSQHSDPIPVWQRHSLGSSNDQSYLATSLLSKFSPSAGPYDVLPPPLCQTVWDIEEISLLALKDVTALANSCATTAKHSHVQYGGAALDDQSLSHYPRPHIITADNGPPFNATELYDFLAGFGIKLTHSTTYNPQSNSLVERVHGSLNNMILAQQDPLWYTKLQSMAWVYRASFHRVLGCSPAEIVFSKNMLFSQLTKMNLLPSLVLANKPSNSLISNVRTDTAFHMNTLLVITSTSLPLNQPKLNCAGLVLI